MTTRTVGHTPGPWTIEPDKHGVARYWIHAPEINREQWPLGLFLASVGNGTNGDESHQRALANARLIAAAPDLLEALAEMVEQYGGMVDGGVEEPAALAVEHAKTALAKCAVD